MGQIIIAGTIDFPDRATRDGAVAAGLEYQRGTRDDEPGCLAYVFAADPIVEHRVQVYELWVDEASLAAHFRHPNYLEMGKLLRGFGITGTDILKHRTDLAEPVYDDTRTPRADFFTA
jgi:quinol monooxygenase YgiN